VPNTGKDISIMTFIVQNQSGMNLSDLMARSTARSTRNS
jgi:hypothetical protein